MTTFGATAGGTAFAGTGVRTPCGAVLVATDRIKDDRIKTERDGAVDRIYCGPGWDGVIYYGHLDPRDVRQGCERVRVVG